MNALQRWWKSSPAVMSIIAITGLCHVVLMILRQHFPMHYEQAWVHIALIPNSVLKGETQQLLTVVLIHDHSLWHILFNMLALFSLGPWVERILGWRHFLKLYVLAALTGSIAFVLWALLPFTEFNVVAVGASGAVLGILTAFALLFPNAQLRLWFFLPIKAKNLIWIAIIIDLLMLLMDTSIAAQAHLGGMFGGWLYLKYLQRKVEKKKYDSQRTPDFRGF